MSCAFSTLSKMSFPLQNIIKYITIFSMKNFNGIDYIYIYIYPFIQSFSWFSASLMHVSVSKLILLWP